MDILAVSIYLRYLSLCGENLRFPDNGYQGQYIKDIAQVIYDSSGEEFYKKLDLIFANVSKDGSEGGDKESHIDGLIENSKSILGDSFRAIFQVGIESILGGIKSDLSEFGVVFEKWFSDKTNPSNNFGKGVPAFANYMQDAFIKIRMEEDSPLAMKDTNPIVGDLQNLVGCGGG